MENMTDTKLPASQPLPAPPGSGPRCSCVSHDAITCATIRDDLDPDDRDYGRRHCECCCHDDYDQDEEY